VSVRTWFFSLYPLFSGPNLIGQLSKLTLYNSTVYCRWHVLVTGLGVLRNSLFHASYRPTFRSGFEFCVRPSEAIMNRKKWDMFDITFFHLFRTFEYLGDHIFAPLMLLKKVKPDILFLQLAFVLFFAVFQISIQKIEPENWGEVREHWLSIFLKIFYLKIEKNEKNLKKDQKKRKKGFSMQNSKAQFSKTETRSPDLVYLVPLLALCWFSILHL